MREGTFITQDDGSQIWVPYEDFDPDILPQLIKPIAGFVFEAGAFIHLPLDETPFYIKDWLPKMGRMMLYGSQKAGKSFMCIQMAYSIASGTPLLGMPTNPGKVLYIQSELGAEVLKGRLLLTKYNLSDIWTGTTFALKLDKQGGQDLIQSALDAVEPDVLILDPLYKMIEKDENETKDMREVADFLDDMIELHKMSIILVHHSGYDPSHPRGSSVWPAWVDGNINIKRINQRGDALRVRLTPYDLRHAELPPEPIEAELQDFRFVKVEGKGTAYEAVLAHFQENDGVVFTPKQLEELELGSHKTIADTLKRLVDDGKLVKPYRGEYMLAPELDKSPNAVVK